MGRGGGGEVASGPDLLLLLLLLLLHVEAVFPPDRGVRASQGVSCRDLVVPEVKRGTVGRDWRRGRRVVVVGMGLGRGDSDGAGRYGDRAAAEGDGGGEGSGGDGLVDPSVLGRRGR